MSVFVSLSNYRRSLLKNGGFAEVFGLVLERKISSIHPRLNPVIFWLIE
jgi:hypothetical protein